MGRSVTEPHAEGRGEKDSGSMRARCLRGAYSGAAQRGKKSWLPRGVRAAVLVGGKKGSGRLRREERPCPGVAPAGAVPPPESPHVSAESRAAVLLRGVGRGRASSACGLGATEGGR